MTIINALWTVRNLIRPLYEWLCTRELAQYERQQWGRWQTE